MNNDHHDARMILALAAEADDEFIWGQIKTLQPEMFAAGPIRIKFAYFGHEGALQTRPCITTNWVTDADDMADIMERGRAGCVCGCYIEIGSILEQALQETRPATIFMATLMPRLVSPSSCARREPDCSCFSKVARVLPSVRSGFSPK
jgi:hypothetical protein